MCNTVIVLSCVLRKLLLCFTGACWWDWHCRLSGIEGENRFSCSHASNARRHYVPCGIPWIHFSVSVSACLLAFFVFFLISLLAEMYRKHTSPQHHSFLPVSVLYLLRSEQVTVWKDSINMSEWYLFFFISHTGLPLSKCAGFTGVSVGVTLNIWRNLLPLTSGDACKSSLIWMCDMELSKEGLTPQSP